METIFKNLKQTEAKIKDLQRQFDTIEEHPYYIVFNRGVEKKFDKEILRLALYDQLSLKQALLETLQIEISKSLHLISQNQRKLTHLKEA